MSLINVAQQVRGPRTLTHTVLAVIAVAVGIIRAHSMPSRRFSAIATHQAHDGLIPEEEEQGIWVHGGRHDIFESPTDSCTISIGVLSSGPA